MREKRRGHPAVVSIGYSTAKKTRGNVMKKTPVVVRNVVDLQKVGKNQIAMLSGIGKKKKIEIAKKAKELKVEIFMLNIDKFLKTNEKKDKKEEKKNETKTSEVKK